MDAAEEGETMSHGKRAILDDFLVIAHDHFDGNPPPSIDRLLARLVNEGLPFDLAPREPADDGMVYLVDFLGDCEDDPGIGTHQRVVSELMRAHLNLPAEHPVQLVVSSEGGCVYGALAIIGTINHLRRSGRKVNAHVAGRAFSAAFDIVQHCDHRTAEPTSAFMYHQEQDGAEGSTTKRMIEARFSTKQDRTIFEVIAQRTGKPVKYYEDKTKGRECYLTAPEALADGLLDAILPIMPFPVSAPLVSSPRRKRAPKTSPPIEGSLTP